MCGEHLESCLINRLVSGSSPRVRGTHYASKCGDDGSGIIPACAGNTLFPRPSYACSRDHPRVCGEHDTVVCTDCWEMGSSPRVRGTLNCTALKTVSIGIIPACAGNTPMRRSRASSLGDHPRVCGEHGLKRWAKSGAQGSSPRVRGTRLANPLDVVVVGIIPACAGNTMFGSLEFEFLGDHPRVCGEH